MSVRRLILAIQFLTRLPTPQVKDFRNDDLSRSAVYYPLVGAIIGALLMLPLYLLDGRPWLAGALALLLWVWVTGALHLDGLGDVADAFGAAHRDPQRFLEVLKDPHMGVFGVVTLVMQLLLKLVLLGELATSPLWYGIVLVPAWARWGTLWWSRLLPSLHGAGMAERFSWQLSLRSLWLWALLLAAITAFVAWPLLLALLLVPLVAFYWRRRLGGISGDCLGASVEVTESLLLLALVLAP
ncbi:adenosylcobinamide-GDP ribazoletransferase [Stenotrophomonas sp. NLF4-10]|uniref:adenosylcobinamide-GDP ribazoletransferase n=1 Tax=Stenotrophomonas sp. NLF4-10 TaxID=2918754 RepID=UPI001EFC291E|nr:adenosylcobinamide-GDP ribazoletransferase [Stenotrophomonas sp. NLF4-10]MCG8275586.1 adenosylcobinamide-GDP ribazoletransferase [Stenotrophomonas sp. NLF4-10]